MAKRSKYTGINIQFPISQLILNGQKTVETRTYPLPAQLVKQRLAFIETPGEHGDFKARVVAFITFGESFKYKDEEAFYRDQHRHCVDRQSTWRWKDDKSKWGWPIMKVEPFSEPKAAPKKKGIVYTKDITL